MTEATDEKAKAEDAETPDTTGADADTEAIENEAGPSLLERKLGKLSTSGALRSVLAAVVLGTVVLAGLVMRPDPLKSPPAPIAPKESKVELGLGYNELMKIGRAALAEGDRNEAKEAFEAAMAKLGDAQIKERLEVCEALALIADEEGKPVYANAYREFAEQLRKRLASAVVVFGAAEDALREKRYDEALRLYRQFLLRRDELPEDQREFIARTRRRIAQLWQERLGDAGALATKINFEPEVWFDAR